MKRIADLVIEALVFMGVNQAFSVTGGASMHLNDAAGINTSLNVCYLHHEQSCAMAAEGYARITGNPALVMSTAGPGALNTLNGVFGSFTDSIPMIVLAGQSRSDTLKSYRGLNNLRQLGDQEVDTSNIVGPITKGQFFISPLHSDEKIVEAVIDAVLLATSGRKGPVWIEIPVDVQGKVIDAEKDLDLSEIRLRLSEKYPNPLISNEDINFLTSNFVGSSRPILLLGTGVLLSNSAQRIIGFAEKYDVPILTAWSHDLIDSNHRLFAGRPGTIGTRVGNFVLQNSDFLLVLGSRLNIRQISYNWGDFAKNAKIFQVDIDANELVKPFPIITRGIHADINDFMDIFIDQLSNHDLQSPFSEWLAWTSKLSSKYGLDLEHYVPDTSLHNPYEVIPKIFKCMKPKTVVVCGDATACIVPFQTAIIRDGIRMFSNSGCASMGYDLPAAIGAAIADRNRPIVCFAGDGSIMMNLQELQSIKSLELDIKVFVLSNGGYLSIRQTQSNFFGRQFGSGPDSNLAFPDFESLGGAFGIPTQKLKRNYDDETLREFLNLKGPRIIVLPITPEQEFQPRLKSRIVDGKIETPSLDDMYPHLDGHKLQQIREDARNITSRFPSA